MRSQAALLVGFSTLFLGGCGVVFDIDEPRHRDAIFCGDGVIGEGEACDDANTAANDGCDATCQIETKLPCGDGWLDGDETCDDGNATADDGCDAACGIEPGYVCAGEPSVCVLTCGDGEITGDEGCDDGNATAGDGCDMACGIEHGFTCVGEPSVCVATCGDGVLASTEQCDDSNTTSGDGCESTCLTGHGYGCEGEPSVCAVKCGDGVLSPQEDCDDGNESAGDGCKATCMREAGFLCDEGEPTKCISHCGDGIVVAAEVCDDDNVAVGDGCDGTCNIEAGFACSEQPSLCKPICGDGVLLGKEECDDHNNVSGDCCSAFCQVEPGCEVEPNGTTTLANALASEVIPVGFMGDGKIRGAIGGVGDEDFFAFDVAPPLSVVRLETFDASGVDCVAGTDTRLTLLNSMGDTLPFRSDDNSGISACSALQITLSPGRYYLQVQQADNTAVISGYTLEVDIQPSAGVDNGINDTLDKANFFSSLPNGFVTGIHQSAADVDYYKLTIPGSSPRSIRAEIIEGVGAFETCESGGIQSRLTLFDAGSVLLADDDLGLGRGLCSLLDGTGLTPFQPKAHDLLPGDYYLRVMAATSAADTGALFDYKLAVTVR